MLQPARRGVTLIELLMVIAIIGILGALSVVGINKAIAAARQRSVTAEVAELASALDMLNTRVHAYPPCMGGLTSSETTGTQITRGDRFDKFLRSMFPRSGMDYTTLKTQLSSGVSPYAYNYRTAAGGIGKLDLSMMDQAEALVFWLGGFPCPVNASGQSMGSRRLIGFHPNPMTPFQLKAGSDPTAHRTPSFFEFDDSRLTDADDDGWLEYVPQGGKSTNRPAPYVYFDADLYASFPNFTTTAPYHSYPTEGSKAPYSAATPGQIAEWGVAVPYAAKLVPSTSIQWMNPTTFQIIAPGSDGMYGKALPSLRIPIYTDRTAYRGTNYTTAGTLDAEEEDNIVNFTDGNIGDG